MTPQDFTTKFYPFAKQSEEKTGINAVATLGQAACESGWGSFAPGNMFFGIKDTDEVNGNEQLIVTFEYSRSAILTPSQIGLADIVHIEPVDLNGQKYFKYTGHSYFRKYNTPEESFTDHAQFFFKNSRYAKALEVKGDCDAFIDAIAAAGYAQSPTYAATLKSIAHTIQHYIPAIA